jgi:hypothetical protein
MSTERTPFDLDHAVQLYRAGHTLAEVGAVFGIGAPSLHARFKTAGVPRRKPGGGECARLRIAVDGDEIVRRYRDGESEKSLSESLGISRSAVRLRLLRSEVQPRGRSEAMFLRWSDLDDVGRTALVEAAHAAVRGLVRSDADLTARARTRAALTCFTSPWEVIVADLLAERGVPTNPQQAVDRYNIDLACWPVAVEVHRSGNYPLHRPALQQRCMHLLDRGWRTLYVWIDPRHDVLTAACADHTVTLVQLAQCDPTAFGEYRVIRGTGEDVTRLRLDGNDLADVRSAE